MKLEFLSPRHPAPTGRERGLARETREKAFGFCGCGACRARIGGLRFRSGDYSRRERGQDKASFVA
jgi:hypothetical protein